MNTLHAHAYALRDDATNRLVKINGLSDDILELEYPMSVFKDEVHADTARCLDLPGTYGYTYPYQDYKIVKIEITITIKEVL